MARIVSIVAFLLALLLAGCAHQRVPNGSSVTPGQQQGGGQATALLLFADRLRGLGTAEFTQELERVRLLYSSDKSDFHLLQYAFGLALPGGEPRKAQTLIDIYLKEGERQGPELLALAQLINADLAERRRLAAGSRHAEADARRADDLEKKVEALKNIEKNMTERDSEAKP